FLQPLNALAERRVREGAELLCDDRAVAATGDPLALARSLARVAGWVAGPPGPAAAPAMLERGSPFVRRIERLVQAGTAPSSLRVGRRIPALSALLAAAVVLAGPHFAPPRVRQVQVERTVPPPPPDTARVPEGLVPIDPPDRHALTSSMS
ncbi:MAG: hypothetical protein JO040_06875, partial [Gemmatimonadetes bacterium]|nr:hypothetical protein [Gemmatimonadota bacterium]